MGGGGMTGGGGMGGMISNLISQMPGNLQGGRPGYDYGAGWGPGQQGGYRASHNQVYSNPAQYLGMGDQYGQGGAYNTLARDLASGNVGNFQFGTGGNPFSYQAGMTPTGRAQAWGAPMSAAQQYGGLGQFAAGRGGMGRQTGYGGMYQPPNQFAGGFAGLGYPSDLFGGAQGYGSPFQANQGFGAYYNPYGPRPGTNRATTPFGATYSSGPLSFVLPGARGRRPSPASDPRAMPPMATTGQGSLPPGLANPGSLSGQYLQSWQNQIPSGSQPIYQSDAWRRQQSRVPLPFQLPAAAGDVGSQRSRFLYGISDNDRGGRR